MIEMITAAQAATETAAPSLALTSASENTGNRFVDFVANELMTVNQQIKVSESELSDFAAGRTDNLHQVMMSLEKAKKSFELVVEARNKVMESYQEIMRMQL